MFKKILLSILAAPFVLVGLWVLWSLIAYRDLPVAELERDYGDASLQKVNIDGVPLRYRVEGEGPDLLLIHSHYFNMRMWNDWMPQLRDRFRVIRFDMTSHGLTGPDSRGDYTMDRDLQLIEGLLQHLQVESFSVAGSSLGGNMAFHLASRWPDRVQALVLMNSGGLPRSGSRGNRGTVPDWVDAVSYLVPTMAFHSFLEWMIVDDAIVTPQMSREFHAMFRRQGNRVAEFERLRQFEVGDPDPVLEGVIAPTLVMWGEDNPQLPVAQVEKFEARLTSAQTFESIVYPAVGHVLPLEAPGSGSADLRRFLLEHVQ